jgi:hypothetical protein
MACAARPAMGRGAVGHGAAADEHAVGGRGADNERPGRFRIGCISTKERG